MKIYKIDVSREVNYWEHALVEIEASSLEEARQIALADAEDGVLEFDTDEFPVVKYEIFEEDDEL